MVVPEKMIAELVLGNAVHILIADQSINENEIRVLENLAHRLGYPTPLSIDKILKLGLTAGNLTLSKHQRLLCLSESLKVMYADHSAPDSEKRAWVQLAVMYGFNQKKARSVLETLQPQDVTDIKVEELLLKVQSQLGPILCWNPLSMGNMP